MPSQAATTPASYAQAAAPRSARIATLIVLCATFVALASTAAEPLLQAVPTAGSSAATSSIPPKERTSGLLSLPLPAQATISGVLGRGSSAYHARPSAVGIGAENSAHGFSADFRRSGVVVEARGGRLGLSLRSLGYGAELQRVAAASPSARKNRVVYRRGALSEWYVNGPLGLAQGFTLTEPPAKHSAGSLTLALTLSGTLRATLQPGESALTFALADQPASLRYRGLAAWDARGRALPASLALEGTTLLLRVDDAGARYPLTIDPFVEQAKLTASDGAADDWFGDSIAVDGDTVVAGAPFDDGGRGSAYVFVKPGAGWANATEHAKLTASDGAADDWFGDSVEVSGDTVVVGAWGDDVGANADQGSIYVFVRPGGGWTSGSETAKLTVSDGVAADGFPRSVAVSGDTVAAGAYGDTVGGNANRGSTYVFVRPGGGWASGTESAKLTASDGEAGDNLGYSVAASGSTVVVGVPGDDVSANAQGSAYVFVKPGTGWSSGTESAKLSASDGAALDQLGYSVAISGDTVVAGVPLDTVGTNTKQGSAYVFVKPGGGWASRTESAKLTASDGAANDLFGLSVAVSGSTVVAGAGDDDVGANQHQGSAYVFGVPGTGWASGTESAKLTAADGAALDQFGHAVAISGDMLVAGAFSDDVGAQADQGSAYVFVTDGPFALTVLKAGNGGGTVTGTGINCGSDCSETYASGTMVTLTATPLYASTFTGWTNCDSPSGNTCTMTMSSSKTVTATFTTTPTFADVPPTNPFYHYIEQLYDLGITQGCGVNGGGQLLFCPTQFVPREQMAAFLVRAKGLSQLFPGTPTFADVAAGTTFFGYIERLYEQGITQGCGVNGGGQLLFCPTQFVPREQMAAFLVRAKGLSQLFPGTPTFADVAAGTTFFGYIERLYEQGITQGCGVNGTGQLLYCPGEFVPRQQMAAFLIRAFATP